MNSINNKRYKETESSIHKAFLTLLEKKQIHEITVKDICDSAQLSRPTFYSHYDDINALIIKLEYEKSNHISTLLATDNSLTSTDFTNYLRYIKDNKNFYIAYFKCESNLHISQQIMEKYITVNKMNATPELRYYMLFFMAGLKAIIFDWLTKDCPESIEQMAQILMKQYSTSTFALKSM